MRLRKRKQLSGSQNEQATIQTEFFENPIENVEEILERLDCRQSKQHEAKRSEARHRYRVMDGLKMDILPRVAGANSHLIYPRNISRGGLAFLHKGIIYPESEFIVWLVALSGEVFGVPGQTMWLRPIGDDIVEAGMRFTNNIEVERFIVQDNIRYQPQEFSDDILDGFAA